MRTNKNEMLNQTNDEISSVSWKVFLKTAIECFIAFYLATFCVAMVLTHRSTYWAIDLIVLGILYMFVILYCVWKVLNSLSIATVMLIIPIAPFIALATVISLIPILQYLN